MCVAASSAPDATCTLLPTHGTSESSWNMFASKEVDRRLRVHEHLSAPYRLHSCRRTRDHAYIVIINFNAGHHVARRGRWELGRHVRESLGRALPVQACQHARHRAWHLVEVEHPALVVSARVLAATLRVIRVASRWPRWPRVVPLRRVSRRYLRGEQLDLLLQLDQRALVVACSGHGPP
eukprot:scaffold41144_cov71-Phaeocystis_antarctica.AAC.2